MARTKNQWRKEFMAVIESEGCVVTSVKDNKGSYHVYFTHEGCRPMQVSCSKSPSDNYAGSIVRQQIRRLIRDNKLTLQLEGKQ